MISIRNNNRRHSALVLVEKLDVPRERQGQAMRILAISGSLRSASLNTALLQLAVINAPDNVRVDLYAGMSQLPLFNHDLESHLPAAVKDLRETVATSDAVIFASPEYVHGISSVTKIALDWLTESGALFDKPVAIWRTTSRSEYALSALQNSLLALGAQIVLNGDLTLNVSAMSELTHPSPATLNKIYKALDVLMQQKTEMTPC